MTSVKSEGENKKARKSTGGGGGSATSTLSLSHLIVLSLFVRLLRGGILALGGLLRGSLLAGRHLLANCFLHHETQSVRRVRRVPVWCGVGVLYAV